MFRHIAVGAALFLAAARTVDASPPEAKRPTLILDAFFALCPFADNGGAFNDAALRAQSAQDMKTSAGSQLTFAGGQYEANWHGEIVNVTYADNPSMVGCTMRFNHAPSLTDLITVRLNRPKIDHGGGVVAWTINDDHLSTLMYESEAAGQNAKAEDTLDYLRVRAPNP